MASTEIKGSYTATGEVNFETTLTATTLIQLAVTAGVLLIFSLFKYLLPMVFCPFYMRRQRKFSIWFLDVFCQPISQYARCGNVAAIFVLYQTMVISLFGIMSLFGLTILIPVYVVGVDQDFNTDYRTGWSKMSLTHVEAGSYAVLVPTVVATIYTFIMMEFYDQFHIVYIYFRQRALRRSAPQNFVVMLDQLPSDIRTYGDLAKSLEGVFQQGVIRYIIPVPEHSLSLTFKYKKLLKLILNQHKADRLVNYYATELEAYMNKVGLHGLTLAEIDDPTIKQRVQKMQNKISKSQMALIPFKTKSRQLKLEILAYAHEMNIDLSHLIGIKHLPPPMPANVTSFNKLTTCTRMTAEDVIAERDNFDLELNLPNVQTMSRVSSSLAAFQGLNKAILTKDEESQDKSIPESSDRSVSQSNNIHTSVPISTMHISNPSSTLISPKVSHDLRVNNFIGPLIGMGSFDGIPSAPRLVSASRQATGPFHLSTAYSAQERSFREVESASVGTTMRPGSSSGRTDYALSTQRPISAEERYQEQQATLGEVSTRSLRPVLTKYLLGIPKSVAEVIRTTFPDHGLGKIDAATIRSKTRQQQRAHIDTPIGRTAFVVFNSQIEATLCSNSLLYMNATEPKVGSAPEYNQIIWGNTAYSKRFRLVMRSIFLVLLLSLFIGYFVPQTYILNLVANNSEQWFNSFYIRMCKPGKGRYKCAQTVSLTKGTVSDVGGVVCYICYKTASMSITLLPVIVQVIFMALLPLVIKYLSMLAFCTSNTEKANLEYRINFLFLIFIVGIIQIMLTSTFNEYGTIDFEQLTGLTLNGLVANIGRNFPAQIFTFINYLITKYFLFSVLTLLRIPDLLLGLLKLMITKDPIAKRRIAYYTGFPYLKQLAYGSHMTVIGFMYSIVAPISTVFVFIIYTVFSIVNRFNILYVYRPLSDSEMSAATDIIKYVSGDTYLGFLLMMIATIAFLIVLNETITLVCAYFLAAIMIIAIIRKVYVDSKFKRAMMSMHLSDWGAKTMCKINPYREKCKPIEADDGIVTYGEEKHLNDLLGANVAGQWDGYKADITNMEVVDQTRQKLSKIFTERMRIKPNINMNHLQKNELTTAPLNLAEPPVSYMRRTSIIFEDFQCEIANELSIKNHELTDDEVRAIAAMYTHPAFALSYIYGPNRPDEDIR
ncbi:Hypothetical protein GLP15_1432 [Giardia lamblia P15]|uniref:CSC1/OSCA1-like 7TM region domain-containing protein n=1 Tax=Giardia intestinalis (strain P15) TaxID=658858 RepID=E1F461_GIAIA|nr:Hypothetical protein GLP15_1432 [Giardia lamblia P15]